MEEDIDLIKRVQSNSDGDSLKKLINKHSGIYINMVNKYIPENFDFFQKEDVLEEKDFCIYNAVMNFDENKNTKFSTYVGNIAKWKCLNIYNKQKKFPKLSINNEPNEDKFFFENFTVESDIEKIEKEDNIERVFAIVDKSKDERVRKIFKMRYSDRKKTTPWKKIAKKLDLSIQGCINIHNNYLNQIKKYVQ